VDIKVLENSGRIHVKEPEISKMTMMGKMMIRASNILVSDGKMKALIAWEETYFCIFKNFKLESSHPVLLYPHRNRVVNISSTRKGYQECLGNQLQGLQ